jgi:DNA-binding beta-propeller fold protein YncE
MPTIRQLVFAAAAFMSAATAQATVLTQSGFTDAEVAVLPTGWSNLYGGIAVDASGNRYVTGGLSSWVFKVTPSGAVSGFAQPMGGALLGLDIIGSDLYIAAGTTISRVPLSGGPATEFAAGPLGQAMGLAHSKDGQNLFISTDTGLYQYGIATQSMSKLSSGTFSALATGLNGTVYATDYYSGKIVAYNADSGVLSDFRAGLDQVAGLAVDPVSGDVFAAIEGRGVIQRISADGSKAIDFATDVIFNEGYYPSALGFDPHGGAMYYSAPTQDGYDFALHQISGFPTLDTKDVPEPASLSLLAVGLAAGAFARRRKAK